VALPTTLSLMLSWHAARLLCCMQMVRLLVAAGAKLEFVRRKPPKITPLVRGCLHYITLGSQAAVQTHSGVDGRLVGGSWMRCRLSSGCLQLWQIV
jgi:hypothetical protein